MRAEDLQLDGLISFGEDSLNLHGRRLVLHDTFAMAHFRQDLFESAGLEQSRQILFRFGYFWGQADAAAMKRIFKWENIEELLKAGCRLQTIQGVARATVKTMKIDEAAGSCLLEYVCLNSAETENSFPEIGSTGEGICWIMLGHASGYASHCLGKDIYFIEKQCRAGGWPTCIIVGKDKESWGSEITPYMPYFQRVEIVSKITVLTEKIKQQNLELEKQRKNLKALEIYEPGNLIPVRSAAFQQIIESACRVASFDTSVLITGESGVGKEVLARYIHRNSLRHDQPFVAINCGALPETLLEGELFGYCAGAFTGASRNRTGLLEQAGKGTILLDEIGDISPATQVKLLRVIQEKEITRLGENTSRKIAARIIAATNKNLHEEIAIGNFREDLYYRLSIVELKIPPLRERGEDILPLAHSLLKKLSKKLGIQKLTLDASCIEYLCEYKWPGNIRELENSLERAAIFSTGGLITPECLPTNIIHAGIKETAGINNLNASLEEIEALHISRIMELCGGNRTKAAAILKISQVTLWRKLKILGLDAK
ncbi:MAG: sigma 54-interacting transcriptional regulator [Victivallaceae bacterium]